MRKFDVIALAFILIVAAGLRVWAPWSTVLSPPTRFGAESRVNFLENDSWYHVRLAESQVRNFPHRITVDPYAAPDGQYVAVAPLLDTIIATAAVLTRGRDASTDYVERVAAFVPAIAGVLAVAAVWALATLAFDRRAGFIAGLLAAVLPGHFLDRTLIGFVDHHALEVLFSFSTLAFLVYGSAVGAGVSLGLYLLAWASGAYFVFILAVWILLTVFVSPDQRRSAARVVAIAGAIALGMVLAFQDPALFRYGTQIMALAGLIVTALAVMYFADQLVTAMGMLVVVAIIAVTLLWLMAPTLVHQVLTDLDRFRPDPTRMAVLEARPLFLYTGLWSWRQPWIFFRSGFFVGLIALAGLAWVTWRSRRADHILIVWFTAANYLATFGQNRFGYYLVPATAVVISWLSVQILDWGGVPHAGNRNPSFKKLMPFQRELAVIVLAGIVFAPNLVTAATSTTRAGGMPKYWFDAMQWLRTRTPEPFGSADFYFASYGRTVTPASFSVMNWWDQGYWIIQSARRVPVSNPTQSGADKAARFLTATNEDDALALLTPDNAKYVIVDWELPFREGADGALAGRFENLAGWAKLPTSRFYSLCFTRKPGTENWQTTWVYREAYYQTMVYRLMVLGGKSAQSANNTYVVKIQHRTDADGDPFCEVIERQRYPSPEEAKAAASRQGEGFEAVGLTPWEPAFSVPAITGMTQASEFRAAGQPQTESPMVRIYRVTPTAAPSPDR